MAVISISHCWIKYKFFITKLFYNLAHFIIDSGSLSLPNSTKYFGCNIFFKRGIAFIDMPPNGKSINFG